MQTWKRYNRRYGERLIIRASTTIPEPRYWGSTRWRLDTPQARKEVSQIVAGAVYAYCFADQERGLKLARFLGEFSDSK